MNVVESFLSSTWGFAVAATVVLALASAYWSRLALQQCEQPVGRWPIVAALLGGASAFLFVVTTDICRNQLTPEVRPSEFWLYGRCVSQLFLILILVVITVTDLQSYEILVYPIWWGIAVGIALAVLSGDLQIIHIWVDWNEAIPQIRGPYLPEWMKNHPHLHGLAWSVTGVLTGLLLTEAVRRLSAFVLGQPAMGSGDVLLMGLIGAFLGWQPTLIAFLIAPLLALSCGVVVRAVSSVPFVPYGPYLAGGAYLTLLLWPRIWMLEIPLSPAVAGVARIPVFSVRELFGDPVVLGSIAGGSLAALGILLGGIRLLKNLPLRNAAGANVAESGDEETGASS